MRCIDTIRLSESSAHATVKKYEFEPGNNLVVVAVKYDELSYECELEEWELENAVARVVSESMNINMIAHTPRPTRHSKASVQFHAWTPGQIKNNL